MDRLTAKLVNRLTATLVNRLTAKLMNRLTAKLVVVNLVKLHLTKYNAWLSISMKIWVIFYVSYKLFSRINMVSVLHI